MKHLIQTLLRVSIVVCILLALLGSNMGILPMGIAIGYIGALTATLMLTYV